MSETTRYPQWSCDICRDTKVIWSPDLDGESMYESACPNPIHDEMEQAARQITEDRRGDMADWLAEHKCWDCGSYFEPGTGYGDDQAFCSETCADSFRRELGA